MQYRSRNLISHKRQLRADESLAAYAAEPGVTIQPGEVFDPVKVGISADEVTRLTARGVIVPVEVS